MRKSGVSSGNTYFIIQMLLNIEKKDIASKYLNRFLPGDVSHT